MHTLSPPLKDTRVVRLDEKLEWLLDSFQEIQAAFKVI